MIHQKNRQRKTRTKSKGTIPSRTSKVILSLFRTLQAEVENESEKGKEKESAYPQAKRTEVKLNCSEKEVDEIVEIV